MESTNTSGGFPRRTKTPLRSLAAISLALVLLGACAAGSSKVEPASSGPGVAFPLTLKDDDGVSVTIPSRPTRIITFAPSLTEVVFALGLGSELVGVSGKYDNYPQSAKSITEVGGAGDFGVDPNVEKVVSLHPDLMLTISGGDQWKQQLRKLGIKVFTLNATSFDDLLHDIDTAGELTGAVQQADQLTASMTTKEQQVQTGFAGDQPVSCFFEVYYPPLTTVGPDTFLFDLLEKAGCDPVSASAKSDYPTWSVDTLVKDPPDVYLVTQESASSLKQLRARPGFDAIKPIADGEVGFVDSDLVTRPGPRVVLGLEQLAAALHPGTQA